MAAKRTHRRQAGPKAPPRRARRRARDVAVHPLTLERWDDFATLFGPRGACGGCWCMEMKLTASENQRSKGAGNKRKQKRLVASGVVPGVLAYRDGEPIGWCAVEPREAYGRLARSRILRPVDEHPAWSITCFFVRKDQRGAGVSGALVDGAVAWARSQGARIVEAYPTEPRKDTMPDVFAFQGLASAFLRHGFREVARRSPTRPIMRRTLRGR